MKITKYEKKNYVLRDKKDKLILFRIKKLEKEKLNKRDKETIRLLKNELKLDWRTPLLNYLNKLILKYN